MNGLMFFLLLFTVSRCVNDRNITPHLGRHGIHVRVTAWIITDAIFSVLFNDLDYEFGVSLACLRAYSEPWNTSEV